MPSTVVRMKPLGLLGPGANIRATTPAMNPIRMIQRKCTGYLLALLPTREAAKVYRLRECLPILLRSLDAIPAEIDSPRSERLMRVTIVSQALVSRSGYW